jgi:general secretion pathway protein C
MLKQGFVLCAVLLAASCSAVDDKDELTAEAEGRAAAPSDDERNVKRAVIDSILENQADPRRAIRIVPEKEGDKVVGVRVFGVRAGSPLSVLGIEDGDRIDSINGVEIGNLLEAYSKLRTTGHITVSIIRNGVPMTIDFNII